MAAIRRLSSRTRSAVFAPIGNAGRAVRVEKRLEEAIRSGVLADGERLPSEAELAALLGVAPVTAREALGALRTSGLVTTTRGRGGGSFVRRPNADDTDDIRRRLSAMSKVDLVDRGTYYASLLAACAELAAERADEEDVEDLRRLLPDLTSTDLGGWRHADTELHLALAALTQSARLSREVMRLEADFGALVRLPLFDDAHRVRVHAHQLEVVAAVAARDGDGARSSMRARVRRALEDLAELRVAVP
ncbi:putative HTH-type transcriptional regulator YegW [Nocardioides dokdonensis FR1436]|uniref:Putative HTH-type transcriptional regulator YegW n=1 Tax=Nocardioides dokdonensis FR1436 TaxID=1300347 RepID=A0A1A9GIC4_9ACTN|nr:GntR family transcriptional regulator [Nocardioides dokdonensis]ANH38028.1 putative HTH-type transcriptional regulator YegW [Nocardioides dokdonensis FR1436]